MRILTLIAALAIAGSAHARCITNDSWTGPDKAKHFVAGAAIGGASTVFFQTPRAGMVLGAAAGVGLELYSARTGRGTCTVQDAAATALGAVAGAYGTAWLILPRRNGVQVAYVARF